LLADQVRAIQNGESWISLCHSSKVISSIMVVAFCKWERAPDQFGQVARMRVTLSFARDTVLGDGMTHISRHLSSGSVGKKRASRGSGGAELVEGGLREEQAHSSLWKRIWQLSCGLQRQRKKSRANSRKVPGRASGTGKRSQEEEGSEEKAGVNKDDKKIYPEPFHWVLLTRKTLCGRKQKKRTPHPRREGDPFDVKKGGKSPQHNKKKGQVTEKKLCRKCTLRKLGGQSGFPPKEQGRG